ncbi:MAG: hypothetical protein WC833_10355 [Bacteroidales bacterium]|jgi:hypothetical protein
MNIATLIKLDVLSLFPIKLYYIVAPINDKKDNTNCHIFNNNSTVLYKPTKTNIMKTNDFFKIALIALFFSSCGSTKPTPGSDRIGTSKTLPCVEKSYDDNEYFRGLGVGTSLEIQKARDNAIAAAKQEIKSKLNGYTFGLSTDYSRITSDPESAQKLIEGELNTLVDKYLQDAGKSCEALEQDDRGRFISYIVYQVPKKDLLKEMEDSLAANKELKTEFNREKFRKYAKEKEKEMKKTKENL